MLGDDILYLSVRELGEKLRKREISPVELAESYLSRSERLGPTFNAYATITRELALAQARAAEKELRAGHDRGPLHGIPYAAKDLVAVKGYRTTWGARPFADQQLDFNAAVIERLNEAGAILIGKAAMIELAGGLGYTDGFASLTGGAKNPWNPEMWTCGSSSGSGAIVSAALAPFALGSDTRGSIICPSAQCGISGLRPSFGRVSRYGAMAIAWTMDKLGPMCRTADDCGLVLSALSGHDPRDHQSLRAELSAFHYSGESAKPLRIGRITDAWDKIPEDLEPLLNESEQVLRQHGATIIDVELPEGPYEQAAELTILMEAAASFQDLIESSRCAQLDDPLGKINGYVSMQFTAREYLQVQRVRTILQKKVDAMFDHVDVLMSTSLPEEAGPLKSPPETPKDTDTAEHPEPKKKKESIPPDGVSSLCGLPAVTVPCGLSKNKLPYGVQFVARALRDDLAIAAANLFQANTEFHRLRPPISH